MVEEFGSPSSYIQGKGVLFESDKYLKNFGTKPLLLAGEIVYKIVGKRFEQYLQESGYDVTRVQFNGESSTNEVNRVTEIGKENNVTVVYGLGGGKTVDTAKAIADNLHLPVVIMPTLASNDAPCSRLSVIYTDDGGFDHYRFYNQNPDLVLVDTQVIANGPVRMLISGIADALATNVEAQAVAKANSDTMLGEKQTLVGNAIAQKCEETLFNYSHLAVADAEAHVVTPAFSNIVEANTLMSGLGFESGGLSGAHAIHDGLTILEETHDLTHGEKVAYGTLTQLMLEGADQERYNKYFQFILSLGLPTTLLEETHDLTHGEKVAYGTLTQLMLEGADQERYNKYFQFILSLGLPTTLADLHLENVTDEELLNAGKAACSEQDTMDRLPFKVTPDDVAQALRAVDAYTKQYLNSHHCHHSQM